MRGKSRKKKRKEELNFLSREEGGGKGREGKGWKEGKREKI